MPAEVPRDLDGWPTPLGGWPDGIWGVPYDAGATPGAGSPSSWLKGSNCQRYAYGILHLYGRNCPPLRSSDLCTDTIATAIIEDNPQPLDLVLFNATADPYGAHVGVWMAHDRILHLSKEVGHPVVWNRREFAQRRRYATLLGFKRLLATGTGAQQTAGATPLQASSGRLETLRGNYRRPICLKQGCGRGDPPTDASTRSTSQSCAGPP